MSVPLFLGEIAPANIKKALGIVNQLFIVFGMLIGQSLSFPFARYSQWRWVFTVPIGMALIELVASFAIVEPRKKKDSREILDSEATPLLNEGMVR